jgi:uncharacterized membrane protein
MKRLFYWLFIIPFVVVLVLFTINNANIVDVNLWPIFEYPVEFTVYGIGLVCVIFGFFVGAVAFWAVGGKSRQRKREYARQLEATRREAAILREQVKKLTAATKEKSQPVPITPPAKVA